MKKTIMFGLALMLCVSLTGCASKTEKEEPQNKQTDVLQNQDDDWNTIIKAAESIRNKKKLHVIDMEIVPTHISLHSVNKTVGGVFSKEKFEIDINDQEGTIQTGLSVKNAGEADDYKDTIKDHYDRVLHLQGDVLEVEGEPVYCENCANSTLYGSTNKTMRITKEDQGGDIQKYTKLFDYPNHLADMLLDNIYVAGFVLGSSTTTSSDIPAKDHVDLKKQENEQGTLYTLTSKKKTSNYENIETGLFMNQDYACDMDEEYHIQLDKNAEFVKFEKIRRYTFTEVNKDISYIRTITFLNE